MINFKTLTKATKEIVKFSKSQINSINKEEKLNSLLSKVEVLNVQNTDYENKEQEIAELKTMINSLEEIKQDFEREFQLLSTSINKESMIHRIELKGRISYTEEELHKYYEQKKELENEAEKIKSTYISGYATLEKLLSKEENVLILREIEDKISRENAETTITFEEAADKFCLLIFEINDLMDGYWKNSSIRIQESQGVTVANIDLDSESYLISIDSQNDSIEIGLFDENRNTVLLGRGYNLNEINWLNRAFNNQLIVKLYNRLLAIKKEETSPKRDMKLYVSQLKEIYLTNLQEA